MEKNYRFIVAALPDTPYSGRLRIRAAAVEVIEAAGGLVFETKDYPKRGQIEVTARVLRERARTIVQKLCTLRRVFNASVLEEDGGRRYGTKNQAL